ncbi:MAG: hypothetical protein [Caudoviricetes sp.]|nr:MAG: hypothetical protein [Caudoviricetes sp.]
MHKSIRDLRRAHVFAEFPDEAREMIAEETHKRSPSFFLSTISIVAISGAIVLAAVTIYSASNSIIQMYAAKQEAIAKVQLANITQSANNFCEGIK